MNDLLDMWNSFDEAVYMRGEDVRTLSLFLAVDLQLIFNSILSLVEFSVRASKHESK